MIRGSCVFPMYDVLMAFIEHGPMLCFWHAPEHGQLMQRAYGYYIVPIGDAKAKGVPLS